MSREAALSQGEPHFICGNGKRQGPRGTGACRCADAAEGTRNSGFLVK